MIITLLGVFILALFLYNQGDTYAKTVTKLYVNNHFDKNIPAPITVNKVVYYPLKEIYPDLGVEFTEVIKGKKITLHFGERWVTATTNSNYIYRNGYKYKFSDAFLYRYNRYYINQELIDFLTFSGFESYWKKNQSKFEIKVDDSYTMLKINAIRYSRGKDAIGFLNTTTSKTFNESKKIISKIITSDMSQLEKEYEVYNYVTQNIDYDHNENNLEVHDVYSAIVKKMTVCDGYAKAMEILLAMVGIESDVVYGMGGSKNHAWNLVNISGKYYYLDATWDNTADEKNTIEQRERYSCFNMSTKDCIDGGRKFDTYCPTYKNNEFSFLRDRADAHGNIPMRQQLRHKETVYYVDPDDNFYLYKARYSSDKICLSKENVLAFWLSSNGIIYSNDNGEITEISNDGKKKQSLGEARFIDVLDNYVCYTRYDSVMDSDNLYMNNRDFNNERIIVENGHFLGNENRFLYPYIFYSAKVNGNNKEQNQLCSYNIVDGSTNVIVKGENPFGYPYNGYLYAVIGAKIYRFSYNGARSEVLADYTKLGASKLEDCPTFNGGILNYAVKVKGKVKYYKLYLETKIVKEQKLS